MLQTYASHCINTKGRYIKEDDCQVNRTIYERDRDRIIHSTSFRKLERKTQVFIKSFDDYCRNRLTHSVEVSLIARSICNRLHLNENLGEAIALAHDIGHPPFAHSGEDALKTATIKYIPFDHNVQAMRVLTILESRYANFDGLNLTWETLDGILKHNGIINNPNELICSLADKYNFDLQAFPSAEAQVAALADDIAYDSHDLDDAFRAGLITFEQLEVLPILGKIVKEKTDEYRGCPDNRVMHEILRTFMSAMIKDLINIFNIRIEKFKINSIDDIRYLDESIACFSEEMEFCNKRLKNFMREHVYESCDIFRERHKTYNIIISLFNVFCESYKLLPEKWRVKFLDASERGVEYGKVVICDYISGMTDDFAFKEYNKLFIV
ncbi:MAG: dNTP triphosphohydrolase [Anaplasmataceae bacterium]|nr:dNTP triphosphohydrolase [Anaplasmataceae bacterium]